MGFRLERLNQQQAFGYLIINGALAEDYAAKSARQSVNQSTFLQYFRFNNRSLLFDY
jgi:hypothetical protein